MQGVTKLLGGVTAATMAVTVMIAGGPRAGSPPLTVADFAAVLTNQGHDGPVESAGDAAQRLVRLGVPLGDPAATLTEGRLALILGYYGLPATTSNPDSRVEQERGAAVASILGAMVPDFGWTEKKKGSVPTTDLSVCLSERNRGQCVDCCKDQGSPTRACAHFCQAIEHPSPSTPR